MERFYWIDFILFPFLLVFYCLYYFLFYFCFYYISITSVWLIILCTFANITFISLILKFCYASNKLKNWIWNLIDRQWKAERAREH